MRSTSRKVSTPNREPVTTAAPSSGEETESASVVVAAGPAATAEAVTVLHPAADFAGRAASDSLAFARIFPPLGIARLGNSPDECFLGPEAPGVIPEVANYKDAEGRVKRQAARFRLYGYDAGGQVVTELTEEHPEVDRITWQVRLANKKAAWYAFKGTKEVAKVLESIGDEKGVFAGIYTGGGIGDDGDPANEQAPDPRNQSIAGDDRAGLTIGPVEAQMAGSDQRSTAMAGGFRAYGAAVPVYLGELRTDAAGRLLVLGGRGLSASVLEDSLEAIHEQQQQGDALGESHSLQDPPRHRDCSRGQ